MKQVKLIKTPLKVCLDLFLKLNYIYLFLQADKQLFLTKIIIIIEIIANNFFTSTSYFLVFAFSINGFFPFLFLAKASTIISASLKGTETNEKPS